jgi:hypothetical protein
MALPYKLLKSITIDGQTMGLDPELGKVVIAKKNETLVAEVAKNGADSLTEDKVAEIQQNMNAMADAQTGGLAVYTRRANEAEAKIN